MRLQRRSSEFRGCPAQRVRYLDSFLVLGFVGSARIRQRGFFCGVSKVQLFRDSGNITLQTKLDAWVRGLLARELCARHD